MPQPICSAKHYFLQAFGAQPARYDLGVSFFAIFFALLLEQVRPLPRDSSVPQYASAWVSICARGLDAGRGHHAWLLWCAVVIVPAGTAWAVHALLVSAGGWVGAVMVFIWHVAILYSTLGFRQFSHHFSAIRQALEDGDTSKAIQLLAAWKKIDPSQIPASSLTRMLMEHAVIAAHRHVFAVLGWYAILAALGLGPAGAVLYRMAELAANSLQSGGDADVYGSQYMPFEGNASAKQPLTPLKKMVSPSATAVAQLGWHVIDFVPARATAMAFAVIGNFEEVVDAWRRREHTNSNDALIQMAMAASLALGDEVQPDQLRSLIGLVWRAVVLWLLLIALLTLTRLLS